jgi:transposase InsO family protein
MRVVEQAMTGGVSLGRLSQLFGPSVTAIVNWVNAYEKGGVDALVPKPAPPPPRRTNVAQQAKQQAVVGLREEHPEYGTRRIRDLLARVEGLGVSETQVRTILHEAGLIEPRPPTTEREHGPRRFERAAPNQMWQSDIFTFLLRRHERLYLTAFMDDHSRFLVSTALAHHQRSTLVMEALARGIAAYGTPQEILTDQGRQYTAWRGETDFEQELRRQGIRHVKSRPQHPQTLGKVERFWKTLWEEFLSRTVFADFADCERRLGLFVDAYNFQRPHQGIEGMVPADRFFRSAPQVREAIEKTVAANAQRLALEQPARKPFYLVGRLGDRDLTIAAAGSGLRVQMGNEQPETIRLPKEAADEEAQEIPARIRETRRTEGDAQASGAPDAPVADQETGLGRDGQTAVPFGLERAQWGAAGQRCDRGGRDLAADVLPARGACAAGDARGVDAGGERARGDGAGEADRGARAQGGAARGGQASKRAAAAFDAQGAQGPDEDGGGPSTQEPGVCELDERWAQTLACLAEESADAVAERPAFDADAGWRERSVTWERKLASADAPMERRVPEDEHGTEEGDVHADAQGAPGAAASVRGGGGGAVGHDDGGGSGAGSGVFPQPLPDIDASQSGGDDRGARAEGGGTPGDAGAGAGAGARDRAATPGERAAVGANGDDRPSAAGGQWPAPGTGAGERTDPAGESQEGDDAEAAPRYPT